MCHEYVCVGRSGVLGASSSIPVGDAGASTLTSGGLSGGPGLLASPTLSARLPQRLSRKLAEGTGLHKTTPLKTPE